MIPYEKVETINKRLKDHYGRAADDRANYRIVWSEDEFENRLCDFTPEGFQLIHPKVYRMPKYRQYIKNMHILERLTVVPVVDMKTLPEINLSYEPIHIFQNPWTGEALPPVWAACKFLIDQLNKQIAEAGVYTKYKHPDAGLSTKDQVEKRRVEILEIEEALYGNETEVTDALAYREGVGFTTSKILEKK